MNEDGENRNGEAVAGGGLESEPETALATAQQQLERTVSHADMGNGIAARLKHPTQVQQVSVPLRRDDGSLGVFTGFRAQRDDVHGPYKGGLRYHPEVTADEYIDLSMRMTWKCAMMGLSFGGGKGGAAVDPKTSFDEERGRLTHRLAEEICNVVGPKKGVPAPDMGTGLQEMAWLASVRSTQQGETTPDVAAGEPPVIGGSYGHEETPGRSIVIVTRKAAGFYDRGIEDTTVTVQGFGSVGTNAARLLDKRGVKVVAVSDVDGVIYDPDGFDTQDIEDHDEHPGMMSDYDAPKLLSNKELLELDMDVLTPVAIGNVTTTGNVDSISAEMIVEGTNGPTTFAADIVPGERGIPVILDILANASGVTVSYFERLQDVDRRQWSLGRVYEELESETFKAWNAVCEHVEERDLM